MSERPLPSSGPCTLILASCDDASIPALATALQEWLRALPGRAFSLDRSRLDKLSGGMLPASLFTADERGAVRPAESIHLAFITPAGDTTALTALCSPLAILPWTWPEQPPLPTWETRELAGGTYLLGCRREGSADWEISLSDDPYGRLDDWQLASRGAASGSWQIFCHYICPRAMLDTLSERCVDREKLRDPTLSQRC